MSDTPALRRRLLRALDLAPLALFGLTACDPVEDKGLQAAKEREQAARAAEDAAKQAEDEAAKAVEVAEQTLKAELDAKQLAEQAAADKLAAELAAEQLAVDKIGGPPSGHGCPGGEWCGTKSAARRFRDNEAGSELGCPSGLVRGESKNPKTDPPATMGYASLNVEATQAKRDADDAATCCYTWGSSCGGGRPLLVDGEPRFAELFSRSGSRPDLVRADESSPARAGESPIAEIIGRAWLEDARMEHASIASFLRAEAELAAVDGPASLREACLRAADDERRHARDCFAIAAAYGEAWQPGELPTAPLRAANLAQLAVDTLSEGGIGETIAALMARRALRRVPVGSALHAALERIAADELEHAALAWQTIAWAIDRGGEPVVGALRVAVARLRPASFELAAADPNADELARHGRLDARGQALAVRDAWVELIDPLLAGLGMTCLELARSM